MSFGGHRHPEWLLIVVILCLGVGVIGNVASHFTDHPAVLWARNIAFGLLGIFLAIVVLAVLGVALYERLKRRWGPP